VNSQRTNNGARFARFKRAALSGSLFYALATEGHAKGVGFKNRPLCGCGSSLSKNILSCKMVNVQATKNKKRKDVSTMANSLAHTKWVCKYHIVFTPKYRRKIIYHELRESIQSIIKDLCKWKGIEIIEASY
jgi:putative transposase